MCFPDRVPRPEVYSSANMSERQSLETAGPMGMRVTWTGEDSPKLRSHQQCELPTSVHPCLQCPSDYSHLYQSDNQRAASHFSLYFHSLIYEWG